MRVALRKGSFGHLSGHWYGHLSPFFTFAGRLGLSPTPRATTSNVLSPRDLPSPHLTEEGRLLRIGGFSLPSSGSACLFPSCCSLHGIVVCLVSRVSLVGEVGGRHTQQRPPTPRPWPSHTSHTGPTHYPSYLASEVGRRSTPPGGRTVTKPALLIHAQLYFGGSPGHPPPP